MGGAVSAVGNVVGGGISQVGQTIFGSTPPSAQSQTESMDPRLLAMQNQQTQNAVNYGNNINAYEQQQQDTATDSNRQALAQQLAGVTQNSNARGLLYGGYNQGQQAQATAQNAANLQNTYAGINTGAQNTLSQLQQQALSSALALNQSEQSQNSAEYQTALAQQKANSGLFGGLLNGVGSFLGGAAGASAAS